MKHLGIDLGTGSVKLTLVTNDGSELSVSETYPVLSPSPGYAETDCDLWLKAIRACSDGLPDLSDLMSIGFSGQMHGVVPCRLTKGALHPAILWADQRGKVILPTLQTLPPSLAQRVRNSWVSGTALTSILWIKENLPDVYEATDVFLLPKDFIRWVMTGQIATDHSDASGTLLYDFESGDWLVELFDRLGLDLKKMPPIRKSSDLAGEVTREGSLATGLPKGVPVAIGAGDTPAAIFGSGLTTDDTIQISIGSGCQIIRLSRTIPPFDPVLNLFETVSHGTYFRMAGMLNGGLALEWVRGIVGLSWEAVYQEIDLEQLPFDLQFLPYLTGERTPYLDPDARGVWSGLGLHHRGIDLVHAALLGVACSVRLGLESIGSEGCHHFRLVGGSSKYEYWNQLLASVLQVSLEVSVHGDASALGASLLGATAIGRPFANSKELRRFEPSPLPEIDGYFHEFKDLYRRLHKGRP